MEYHYDYGSIHPPMRIPYPSIFTPHYWGSLSGNLWGSPKIDTQLSANPSSLATLRSSAHLIPFSFDPMEQFEFTIEPLYIFPKGEDPNRVFNDANRCSFNQDVARQVPVTHRHLDSCALGVALASRRPLRESGRRRMLRF